MAEQTHKTDMSDQPDRQDLEDRVEQLESTISKMLPGRRDALKLGGAALVGGAAMSGSASAGTGQAGTIGTANDPVDVESEDINNADTLTTEKLVVNNGLLAGELIGSDSGGSKQQVTGINFDEYKQIVARGNFRADGSTDVELTFDDVNSGGEYHFFDNDGTIQNTQNTLRLLDANNSITIIGTVVLTHRDTGGRFAVESNLAPTFRDSRTNKIAIKGACNLQLSVGSFEIFGVSDSDNFMELYGIR